MILDGLDGLDGCSISVLERLALQMVYSKATAQKMKEVFKERQRCRQKGEDLPPDCDPFLLKTFKKRVAIANQYFAEVVEEWHAVKSSPGPRCVMVEYPMPFDWQCDVQVYEAPQQRCIHRLVDGMPSCRLEEIMELVVAAVSEDGPAQRAGVKEGDRLISIGMRSDSWNSIEANWAYPRQPVQTLAFEVRDPLDDEGGLSKLLRAAGGPGQGEEDFSAFVSILGKPGCDTSLERAAWEAVQSFQCRRRQRCTRQEVLVALQMSGQRETIPTLSFLWRDADLL
ncbi:unnamed protein product [Durusdinium trenchii]|uniref:PDZ domain-containing protein n=1 Tax=Durusdinium trenchii TaxID=1381693 RepID=A0ABP0I8P5_9DINO